MADEFNPQGVDQTPQDPQGNPQQFQNPDAQVPQTSDAATQSTSQAAAQSAAQTSAQSVTQPQAPASANTGVDATATQSIPGPDSTATASQAPVSEPVPDYASAKGESTVVSSTPSTDASASSASAGQSATQPLYRPAPEFGAYGPVPTANQQGAPSASGQPTQPLPFGQSAPQQPGQPGNRNPYFTNNPQPTAPSNGNPFAPQSTPNGQNNGQNNAGGLFGFGAHNGANGANGAVGTDNANANGTPNGPVPPQSGFPQPGQPGQSGQPGQPGAPASKGLSKTASSIVAAVVAAVVAAALCLGLGYAAITYGWVTVPTSSSLANVTSNKSGSGSATAKTGEAPDWQTVAGDVSGSVVSIQTQLSNGTAKGSGAIISTEGYIVTNNHVISGAQQIQVTLANGTMYSAQLVGTDTTTDLAVIKLDNPPSDLKAVEFADSDKLAVGENVMAIGNPLGYDDTATTGIVSALNRPVTVTDDNNNEIVTNAVQIDAAINPGNSGGPTFNAAGQVIGINSSIASTATSSESAGSIGIGFAIPSNLVKRVADEIIKDGSAKHVALGVVIKSDTVEADGVTRGGATVTKPSAGGSAVVSGGPADNAGIKEGDTIVAFNGNAVNNNYSLLGFVRAAALGDKVTLTIVRDGKTMDVDVTLDKEESSVNGSSSSNSNNNNQNQNGQNDQNGQNGQNDQNGNGSNGDSNGNNDGGTGDDGGFTDPFGLW
ncbi:MULTISPECIES: S1C family serine protease [unclassified Bifidobacterium]|uniref:S1C family serine protease n=1 Tax=unclassified Bifidobacterium TaxID=2608897 RepID=UPI00112EF4D9|nr:MULTISPECIES: trypsin-like peptidase domain-containing protein [unclassified Bifidobacterium]TPF78481.1 peptidase [Bifidobacterium sp. UTCIF-1]TPF79856.1 peptidase [Bifidobacterium sp. UTCIF-24]TPF82234.1 peptidase [Bifidobacterium sp. UTCIF-3]TPF84889.1 peptidase [Bifidobacterium sp. UTCIF-36]TPF88621.1 peptidase [Bifidobacterium sp. UTBIF-56]